MQRIPFVLLNTKEGASGQCCKNTSAQGDKYNLFHFKN
jgi:hypothetical protein